MAGPYRARGPKVLALTLVSVLIFILQMTFSKPAPGAGEPVLPQQGTFPGIQQAALGKFKPALLGLPQFNFGGIAACIGAQSAAIFDSYRSQKKGGQTLSDLSSSVGSKGYMGSCPSAALPEFRNSCDLIQVDGKTDADLVKSLRRDLTTAKDALECRDRKLNTINSHLTCLDGQMKDLNRFLEISKFRYTDAVSTAKANLIEIESIEESRKGQMETIGKRLNGDESGFEGLRQVARRAKDYITGAFPAKILQVTTQQRTVDRQRAALVDLRKTEQARIAATCFRLEVNRADFRCGRTAGDKPVSAYDFVLCRVEQNSFLGKDGQVEDNANRRQQAGANRAGLQSLLDAIMRDMPIPQGSGAGNSLVPKANRLLSPDDIARLYGAQLRRYSVPGFNTYDIVMKSLTACYNRASADIKVLENKPGELLYENQLALKNLEDQQATAIDTLLTESTEVYDSITKSLTGLSIPVDPRACRAAAPAQQINCLNDLKRNMQNLLSGVGDVSPHTIDIPGMKPEHNIRKACTGVNGCLAMYEGYYRALDTEYKRVGNFKKKFVSESNNNLGKITSQLQNQSQQQMKALDDYRSQMNSLLANLGVDEAIEFKTREPEKPTYGGRDVNTGIMDAPNDMAKFLGLPDLEGGAIFTKVRTAAGKKRDEVSRDLAKAKTQILELKILEEKCHRNAVKSAAKALDEQWELYLTGRCWENEPNDNLRRLVEEVRKQAQLARVAQELSGSSSLEGKITFAAIPTPTPAPTPTPVPNATGGTQIVVTQQAQYGPQKRADCYSIVQNLKDKASLLGNTVSADGNTDSDDAKSGRRRR